MMKLFTILSLAAGILAQSCPDGSSQSSVNGFQFCCPGITSSGGGVGPPACILGCSIGYQPCYPFCTAPGTSNDRTTSGVCTTVPVTASDYSSRVFGNAAGSTTSSGAATTSSSVVQSSSAPSNTLASTTASSGTVPATASGTAPTSVASSQASAATQQTSQTAAGAAPSSASVSRGAAAMVTAAPMLIAGALAGMVFA